MKGQGHGQPGMTTASEQAAARLRARIMAGQWQPGSRLPDRGALARELDVCLATLQQAIHCLVRERCLQVGPRKNGTYVAPHPPHLSRYRLIFPHGPDAGGAFWRALESAARARTTAAQEFLCFYGLNGHRAIAEYQAIVTEVQTWRVAGLIFASSADELQGTPLLEQPGLPRVAIAGPRQLPGLPKVCCDLDSFVSQAVGTLLEAGRRRLAILCAAHASAMLPVFRAALAARGLVARDRWEQFASARNPLAAQHLLHLLMDAGQRERPDGLIVADDNLLSAAADGLVQAGVRVPHDLTVVTVANHPHLPPVAVPVVRIGFDIPAMLDLLVLRLQQLHRGETPVEHTALPARPVAAGIHPAPPQRPGGGLKKRGTP